MDFIHFERGQFFCSSGLLLYQLRRENCKQNIRESEVVHEIFENEMLGKLV